MKTVILISLGITAAIIFLNFSKVNFKENSKGGIQFHQGTWEQALELAKKEQKVIFLDVYATWCGPCKMLKRLTFSNNKVGEYYNENFINVALDGESGEGPAIVRLYGVRAYPSLLFIDSNGKLINYSAGFRTPSDLIDLGKSIIQK